MGKSEGNAVTLSEFQKKARLPDGQGFVPLDFRYFALTAHYRSPLSFSWRALEGARSARQRLEMRTLQAKEITKKTAVSNSFRKTFLSKVNDDLNIPRALGFVWKSFDSDRISYNEILFADMIFGLGLADSKPTKVPPEIKALLTKREGLRRDKKWAEADIVRSEIQALGYDLKDTPVGPKITKKTR